MLWDSCREAPEVEELSGEKHHVETGTVTSGQFQLRYRIEGSGVPTLVIGSSVLYPRVFSENLRSNFRLVFLDHRGFSPTPSGPFDSPTDFSLDRLIDDMELARAQLGLGRIVVVGHSGHSFMALEYAKKYPAHVSHVVMIGIGPDLSGASREATERNWQDFASAERKSMLEENRRRYSDEVLAQLPKSEAFVLDYVRNGPRIWFDPRFDSSPIWEGTDVNTEMFDYVWGVVFRDIDITQGLESFDRPVFLALGRYDFLVPPPSAWEPLRSRFSDLTIRVFEKSGHTPQHDEPEVFDEELLAWLRSRE
jgi:proline iminopeptidase